jgi:hypothetical protein
MEKYIPEHNDMMKVGAEKFLDSNDSLQSHQLTSTADLARLARLAALVGW